MAVLLIISDSQHLNNVLLIYIHTLLLKNYSMECPIHQYSQDPYIPLLLKAVVAVGTPSNRDVLHYVLRVAVEAGTGGSYFRLIFSWLLEMRRYSRLIRRFWIQGLYSLQSQRFLCVSFVFNCQYCMPV
jgi:hypothetical protein